MTSTGKASPPQASRQREAGEVTRRETRRRLLDFPEAQSSADLKRCQRRVREVQARREDLRVP